MLVLSVRQPWAWLIIHGGKDIENRNWTTNVRGRVLIHASKSTTKREWAESWDSVHRICPDAWAKGVREIRPGTIALGGIIGSVEIVDCVNKSDSPWFFGRFGYVLRDPQPIPFFQCRGKLGFFQCPEYVEKHL